MVEFQVFGKINATTDQELIDALTWLNTNHGTKFTSGSGRNMAGVREVRFHLSEATLNDAINTLTSIKTQFTTNFVDYGFDIA